MANTKEQSDFTALLWEGLGEDTEHIEVVSFDDTSPYASLLDDRLKAEADELQPLIKFETWREIHSLPALAVAVLLDGKPMHVFLVCVDCPIAYSTYEAVVLGVNAEEKQQGSYALRLALKAATNWARQHREGWLFILLPDSRNAQQQIETAFKPNGCYLEAKYDMDGGVGAVVSFFCQDTA
jgi:hypothetical protein